MKKCKMDASLTQHLRNPYDGMVLVRLSKDSQEIDPVVAEKLCELIMQQPDYGTSDSRNKRDADKLILKKQKINSE